MRAALDVSLDAILAGDEEHAARFRKLHGLIDGTPALVTGRLRRYAELEQAAAAVIARRMDVDPTRDARPHLVVASFLMVVRVAYQGCARDELIDPSEIVPRVRELIAQAAATLPGAWSAA